MNKTIRVYGWHPITKEPLQGEFYADESPLEDGVYHLPQYTTKKSVPALKEHECALYDETSDNWVIVADYRGDTLYSKTDGEPFVIEKLGDIPENLTLFARPSKAHDWDAKKSDWTINKTKQAELDKQAALAAGQARLVEIEQAIQSHINQTVVGLGMGFTDDQSLIGKYAGYDNVFRPIAESVGKWVAEIWYLAAQDKAAIVAGNKAIPTVDEALAQILPFVMPEQQKVGE